MKKLPVDFYLRPDVVEVAKELLGKMLVTNLGGYLTSVMITETEAYEGITDKASHAFGSRFTERTKTMYESGGISYVYLCYGIHSLFNIVTNKKGTPHAVLIRAGQPVDGVSFMLNRRQKTKTDNTLCCGPGTLSKSLGIDTSANGLKLNGQQIWLSELETVAEGDIISSARVGVDYAGEDALLPYRFRIKGNSWCGK